MNARENKMTQRSDHRSDPNETKLEQSESTGQRTLNWSAPPVDIYENKDEFLIVADLPGVDQKDVRIHYERGRIDLEAQSSITPPKGRVVLGAPLSADYRRSFSVPGTIDVQRIDAELKEGVLFLHLPKSEQAKPRQIQVKMA